MQVLAALVASLLASLPFAFFYGAIWTDTNNRQSETLGHTGIVVLFHLIVMGVVAAGATALVREYQRGR